MVLIGVVIRLVDEIWVDSDVCILLDDDEPELVSVDWGVEAISVVGFAVVIGVVDVDGTLCK